VEAHELIFYASGGYQSTNAHFCSQVHYRSQSCDKSI